VADDVIEQRNPEDMAVVLRRKMEEAHSDTRLSRRDRNARIAMHMQGLMRAERAILDTQNEVLENNLRVWARFCNAAFVGSLTTIVEQLGSKNLVDLLRVQRDTASQVSEEIRKLENDETILPTIRENLLERWHKKLVAQIDRMDNEIDRLREGTSTGAGG